MYNYKGAVNMPLLNDANLDASKGHWSNKSVSLLDSPTAVPLDDDIKLYIHDTYKYSKPDAPARQTQVWLLATLQNLTSSDLWMYPMSRTDKEKKMIKFRQKQVLENHR